MPSFDHFRQELRSQFDRARILSHFVFSAVAQGSRSKAYIAFKRRYGGRPFMRLA